ncbi:DUF4132 domain-containing protein [Spirillospora sp. NPDC029432]|uniref:DUF4132 domain-containing protein n=1 Tax=Spirillospora sp. NPDC029432 TaxID=3154599 RepID=UPI003456EAE6
MTETPARVEEAAESSLPDILVAPPWTREKHGAEPAVLKLKAPKEPPALHWAPGTREKWREAGDGSGWVRLPEDTDWDAVAETFAGGAAADLDAKERRTRAVALIMQAPPEYGERLLADERYWDDIGAGNSLCQGIAARHGLAAHAFLVHKATANRLFYWLDPYLSTDVAQIMIKHFDAYPNRDRAVIWYRLHGRAAARLTVPDALRKPGPKRTRAEEALRLVAQTHGHDAIVAAAAEYGEEAERAIAALRTDPLDLYPDPLPELPESLDPANLPQLLLRGREEALPESATRNFIMMLAICEGPYKPPYPGVPPLAGLFDPASLAEFVWALRENDSFRGKWARPGFQYAIAEFGDDATADRLAPIVARWSKAYVWDMGGTSALRLFSRLGTDTALRHLDRLAKKAADQARIRPDAQRVLNRVAEERGLTREQLGDRLVPDFGLDAEGGMTLDYGHRTFRVGFDEQLKPYVTDGDGKARKTLPKPGVRDDGTLAPAAYKRFADLKKEVRTVAADQLKRLEKAMVSGRGWTAEEFASLFVRHPLMWHIARRLVWSAGTATFRIAEDRTLADAADEAFTLPADARVTLPHPLNLSAEDLKTWSDVLADYEIVQPFPQLGRPVFTLADEEAKAERLTRFEGLTVHFGRIMGLTGRGWELGQTEDGGFRRQALLQVTEDRWVEIGFSPGIRVIAPDEYPDQDIRWVVLGERRHGRGLAFGSLDPAAASEVLAELDRLTEAARS